jgi:H+/gluconate symporter-like permease
MLYPVSLLLIVLLIFTFYRNNNIILLLIAFSIGGYIIYSHETGYTATQFKDEMIDSFDKSARAYSETHGYDTNESASEVK